MKEYFNNTAGENIDIVVNHQTYNGSLFTNSNMHIKKKIPDLKYANH
jgi:hypothetical protein